MGELNITGNGEFLKFLQPSENLGDADIAALKYLVLKYPYCQPLHFAYLSALRHKMPEQYDAYLAKASVYAPRRDILHSFIFNPGSFYSSTLTEATDDARDEAYVHPDAFLAEKEEQPFAEIELSNEVTSEAAETSPLQTDAPEQNTNSGETESGIIETVIPDAEHLIEEVTEINARELEAPEGQHGDIESLPDTDKITLVGSIAASDYFVFNRSTVDPLKGEKESLPFQTGSSLPEEENSASDIAKYDDDTMPYSFLWWLHKTRKEYAGTYQPFVRNPHHVKRTPAGELNQQIIENIFHIQPELNTFEAAAAATTVEFELKKKEDEIIRKFITEEPQIRPPQATKLDSENKARKSSEDTLELVSETLAKIYTDQMLYHKAIEIYKKLSLKFPDKKLYFAGQIEELEKKIS